MNEEIKEILEELRDSIDNTGTNKVDFINWVNTIEDYITNLQQAAKKQQKSSKKAADDMLYELNEENEKLKSRIEKAKIEISELLNRYLFEEDFYIEDFHLDKVLKTLDGRSDE